ncbi:cupin domain-containing protein [Paraburkholderia humisilvae]|uniref:Cupin type-2 domain-containing protein n=1 Tax=Paraburkholderia humisilvae TaxID=627669 RepID=A0A6J5EZK3_9BURK|nr:cupin domain-containing protein [Paraburkholderia humisilvae]CAB3771573.1 hypothetical protein LMG29542_06649 [Paraburkholderia humisilvae]
MQVNAAARVRFSSASYRLDDFLSCHFHLPQRPFVRGSLVALATVFGVACSGAAFAQEPPAGIKIETLLKTDKAWDGTRYHSYPSGQPQLSVLKIDIPAHSVLPWHTHPMPNAGYVLAGEITVEKENGEKQTVRAGQVLPETVGSVHRGVTGDSPVTLIVFYAGVQGLPLSQHP